MDQIKCPKKLIEVALPLDDINAACAHEKMPGIGPHPRGIHLWWARRPLAAARAVLFAQMVNDPGYERELGRGVNKKDAEIKREKLFQLIRELVKWENTNNDRLLKQAKEAIWESWRETCHLNRTHPMSDKLFNPEKLPAFYDPFAGGGAIPLEAQRLGIEAYASDLNPVAVMINKAMIEIPSKYCDINPIGPIPKGELKPENMGGWTSASGLAEDVRRYGHWMQDEALKKIGHLYPKVKITPEMTFTRKDLEEYVGKELTVIAWLWARTVNSPNPAYSHVEVPLISNFVLSSKKGKEAWIDPIIEGDKYRFEVKISNPPPISKKGTKTARGANFYCLVSKVPMESSYIKAEGLEGRMGSRLMAIVAQGKRGKVYLSPTNKMEKIAKEASPAWIPETEIPPDKRSMFTPLYGLTKFGDLYTHRQLVTLSTLTDLVQDVKIKAISDAKAAGMKDDGKGIDAGGTGATAYGEALSVYLSFVIDRCSDFNNSLTGWGQSNEKIMHLFSRQAIPMVWDFGEANIMEKVVGGFITNLEYQVKCLLKSQSIGAGHVEQQDAAKSNLSLDKIISTDPPYYDNIGYADLSDFFYVWMRRTLQNVYPKLFSTIAVPKVEELVAIPYRHSNKDEAEVFFLDGMTKAFQKLSSQAHPAFPVSIYYAFKQSETKKGNISNTGWETFLEAVLKAGFSIDGTWPMRSEQTYRVLGLGSNTLASSIVLVCRKRSILADSVSRRDFQRELRQEMPEALEIMTGGQTGQQTPIAPVDLSQAAIGPGMAIFSKYEAVLNQDGSEMSIHDALVLINREITEYLNPDAGNFDEDTLFCSSWFEQYAWKAGVFGEADVLSRAKGTSIDSVKENNIIDSGGGKVRLFNWSEYPKDWEPKENKDKSVWQICHHLIRVLNQQSESDAGLFLSRFQSFGEQIRQLAYHLYTICERKKWAEDARVYNELIGSWHQIVEASLDTEPTAEQISF
jgi:putative DNA methylase